MSIEQNKQRALAFLKASAAHDAAVVSALLAEEATYWVQGVTRHFKYAGAQTRDQIVAYMATPTVFTRKLEQSFGHITAEGNRVAVEVEFRGETADGRVYENTYHYLFVFDGDRINAVREYLDTAVAAEMFG